MAETTLADLISDVADAFGKYRKGTVSSDSSTTTLIDEDSLIEPDDYWIGNYVYILTDAGGGSAAPEGEERAITDYDQGDHKATVSPAFTASVSEDDVYEVLPLRRSQIQRAVNQAIKHADKWFAETTNTSAVTVDTEDYDYSLPSNVVQLQQMWTRDDTDEQWVEVPGNQWHVANGVLYFDNFDGMDDGHTIRLEYLARPSTMSDDTDTLGLGEPEERECVDFIVNYALYWLHRNAASEARGGEAFRPHLTLAEYQKQEADKIKQQAGHRRPAGRVHGAFPPRSLG
jgi:hypothetical protein